MSPHRISWLRVCAIALSIVVVGWAAKARSHSHLYNIAIQARTQPAMAPNQRRITETIIANYMNYLSDNIGSLPGVQIIRVGGNNPPAAFHEALEPRYLKKEYLQDTLLQREDVKEFSRANKITHYLFFIPRRFISENKISFFWAVATLEANTFEPKMVEYIDVDLSMEEIDNERKFKNTKSKLMKIEPNLGRSKILFVSCIYPYNSDNAIAPQSLARLPGYLVHALQNCEPFGNIYEEKALTYRKARNTCGERQEYPPILGGTELPEYIISGVVELVKVEGVATNDPTADPTASDSITVFLDVREHRLGEIKDDLFIESILDRSEASLSNKMAEFVVLNWWDILDHLDDSGLKLLNLTRNDVKNCFN